MTQPWTCIGGDVSLLPMLNRAMMPLSGPLDFSSLPGSPLEDLCALHQLPHPWQLLHELLHPAPLPVPIPEDNAMQYFKSFR